MWGRKDPAARVVRPVSAAVSPAASTTAAGSKESVAADAGARGQGPGARVAAAKELRLQLDAVDLCWVSISADGRPAWEGQLGRGPSRTVTAARSIELLAGNAGALVLTLNGKTLPPLGRKGEVKKTRYTSADLPKDPGPGDNRP